MGNPRPTRGRKARSPFSSSKRTSSDDITLTPMPDRTSAFIAVIPCAVASTWGFTPPLAEHVEIVRLGIECSPCFDRTCRFGHYNCLRQLMPQAVSEALQRLQGTVVEVK